MFYPYIAEMNEILTYSDVFIEPFEFDVEIKNINPYKALSIISELLAVRNMTFLVNAEIPLIGKIEVDVPYQMFLKKEFGDIVLSSSTEMFSDYRLMKNRHIIALQPMLILAKHIILCADEGMDTEENFTVSKDDYKTVIKLALKVAEKISERDSEKFDVSNFLYGTYHINNDHNVANEFARSYYILEKIGKKSEDFPEDIRAEYKDYWTAFKERYGYSMTEFLYSLFWELRKYYARDYYLTYSSSWEDIGAIYKESAMRLIAPMVIRNQAGTLAEYKEWCESSIDEMWDFKGFLEKPFIKTPAGKTLSLSELTLKNSFFENLFWNIPRTESRIMSFYGRLFEMYIQDQIEAIANGQKKYLYIREFRYGKGGGNKSSDAYLRIDNKLLAIEAKGFSVLLNDKYIGNVKRYDLIYKYYKKYRSKRALGFCSSRMHAEEMAKEFCKRGVKSVAVYSNADGEFSEERNRAIEQLKNQEIKVIFSVDMFNEGVDIASLDMVMFLRPTESPTVFLQQLGRGLRISKGKEYVNVLDFIGNYEKAGRAPFLLNGGACVGERTAYDYSEIEYPDDCIVDFDMRLIDLFREMDKKSLSIQERIKQEYYRVKELLDGKVPTRMELFTNMDDNIYEYCMKHSKENPFKRYMDFLYEIHELSDEELLVYNGIGKEFLQLIETTDMQKVYKMKDIIEYRTMEYYRRRYVEN